MGLYDRVAFEANSGFETFEHDPTELRWQTKTIGRPRLDKYKITEDGRLLREKFSYEQVPEEERPRYDEEIEGFEREVEKAFGSIRRVHEGWEDTEYHGVFTISTIIDDTRFEYEVKFTDGKLESIVERE